MILSLINPKASGILDDGLKTVLMGCRPGGSSSIVEISRSPKAVRARVRGIGVAVIISICGFSPLARKSARCITPNLCCSSITSRPSFWNATSCWIKACVPITKSISPASIIWRIFLRSVVPRPLFNSAIRTCEPARSWVRLRKCCSASISVGAINAACSPFPIAARIA